MKLSTQTHFSQGWNTRLLDHVDGLGTDIIRDAIPWNLIETKAGRYDFEHNRAVWVDEALEAGIDVLLTFNPINPLYDNGKTIYSAAGLEAFADYVVATLEAYPGVTAIEIGNEYNSNAFVSGKVGNSSLVKRDDYYFAMIEAVDSALGKAGIDVEVIGASTHSIPVDYIASLQNNGSLGVVDGISIHPYTTPPEQFAQQLDVLRDVVGDDLAIHVTEFGSDFASLDEAPAYLAKMVSVMAEAEVASANWYAFAEQKWFPNMELWDQHDDTATPAGVTFAVLEGLLADGVDVTRVDVGDHAFMYAFGDHAAIIWGEPRSIALDDGVTAWDLAGKQITDFDELSFDTPVILRSKSTIGADSIELGASALLADSYLDFDVTNEPGGITGFEGPWSYFAERSTGELQTLYTMGGGVRAGEPWTPYLGTNSLRPFQVGAVKISPADFSKDDNPAGERAVVERFTSSTDTVVTIKGFWDVADHSDDGVQLTIRLNDQQIFTKKIFNVSNGHEFDLELGGIVLEAGDTLDFVVHSRENATGDVTTRHIQIFDETIGTDAGAPEYTDPVVPPVKEPAPEPKPEPEPELPVEEPAPPSLPNNPYDFSDSNSAERIRATDGDDVLLGGSGNDKLFGNAGADALIGGKGNDKLYADADDTYIDGGAGYDTLFARGSKGVELDLAQASIENAIGNNGNDIFDASGTSGSVMLKGRSGHDTLTGGSGADKLFGEGGADTLLGGGGNDRLDGGWGADVLDGGAGDDRLTGGGGRDTFRFSENFGSDQITDFAAGDKIDLGALGEALTFADLDISYHRGKATINTDDGEITLLNIDADSLSADDFLF